MRGKYERFTAGSETIKQYKMSIKLTAYSHGAGCGCKLSPAVLSEIIGSNKAAHFEGLLVGNDKKDDAAVMKVDEEKSVISTCDFFMPIVDDPYDFGRIAACNAISDVYAMGGKPLMAIAILAWPIDKLSTAHAAAVLEGARAICAEAGIPLAGGHSIDGSEPIFGLSVNGLVANDQLRRNDTAREGDLLYLSKPLGVGLVSTAQKAGKAQPEDLDLALKSMCTLNEIGQRVPMANAMTDVTGFGLAGHLVEMAEASGLSAEVEWKNIPRFDFVERYLSLDTLPGGTHRNWASYGAKLKLAKESDFKLLADPQTSGGLLISVAPENSGALEELLRAEGLPSTPIGNMVSAREKRVYVR